MSFASEPVLFKQLKKLTMDLDAKDQLSSFSRQDEIFFAEKSFKGYQSPLREAAVLILLIHRNHQPYIVLTKRTETLPTHQGQIAFPGGKIDEADKTPAHAALREAKEEIGTSPERISLIGKLPLYQTATGFSITPVVATLEPPYIFERAIAEVDEIFELPLEFMMDLNSFKRDKLIYKGKTREFWVLPFENYYIWGATAAILRELAGRFHDEKAHHSIYN